MNKKPKKFKNKSKNIKTKIENLMDDLVHEDEIYVLATTFEEIDRINKLYEDFHIDLKNDLEK